jgi:transposase-like protein
MLMSDHGHDDWGTRAREEVDPPGEGLVPSEAPAGAELGEVMPSMQDLAAQLVSQARADGVDLTGQGGLLTELMRQVLQTGLEAEMDEHVGYPKHAKGQGDGNARNGTTRKRVTTEIGPVELQVPRDRAGTFEPKTVPKHQRRLDGLSDVIISLYAKGMSTGEVKEHLLEIYGTQLSKDTISRITDRIVDDMRAWQNRPLDPLYAVLLIDAIVVKVRDSNVANRPVYVAIGVNMEGEREVLGLWLGPSGGEGSKQWASMLGDIKNRGLRDALIVCCDGLKGLPESIRLTWPEATVQTCVVHMVRNGLRYAARRHWKAIAADMKEIYTAPNEAAAAARFEVFRREWEEPYPALIASWERAWDEFTPFLAFPTELRSVVYTTNAIESLNARFRRVASHRGHFPTEQAAMKVLYLIAIRNRPNRQDLTGRIRDWNKILNALYLNFAERIEAASY